MSAPNEQTAPDVPDLVVFAGRVLGGVPRSIDEISNGNLNRVFRAANASGSTVIKMGLPYVWRAGLSWPLSARRTESERRAYLIHEDANPGMVPKVLGSDRDRAMLALEDLHEFTDWRSLICGQEQTPGVGAATGVHVGRVLMATSPAYAGHEAMARRKSGNRAMLAFTEHVVFRAPYEDDETNRLPVHLRADVDRMRRESTLARIVERSRWRFLTARESFLHGDLHSGSIMVRPSDGSVRFIDLEFANYGPVAFDIGTFLAHLLIARARFSAQGDEEMARYIDDQAADFWQAFEGEVNTSSSRDALLVVGPWIALDAVQDFMATEMLRRIIGYFDVPDIATLPQKTREAAERIVFDGWSRLVSTSAIPSFERLWRTATGN